MGTRRRAPVYPLVLHGKTVAPQRRKIWINAIYITNL